MSFEFTPMSDDELDAILPDGEYNFEVISSKRKSSAKGNPMAVLDLRVWDNKGQTHLIFDMLIFMNVNMCIRKISRFCKATGIYEDYKKGSLPEDFSYLSGKALIGTQEEMPNPNGGFYPKKNVVLDYIPQAEGTVKEKTAIPKDDFDDDVPF